jgi:large subunit ribosomal protein L4
VKSAVVAASHGSKRALAGLVSVLPVTQSGAVVVSPLVLPGEENYTKEMNVKAKRLAIRQALSLAADANKVIVIEDVVSKEGKTSELAKLARKVGANRRTLLVVDNKNDLLIRATDNLGDVKLVSAKYLNVYDVLNADSIVVTNPALLLSLVIG